MGYNKKQKKVWSIHQKSLSLQLSSMEQIERITRMEQCLDQLAEATQGLATALDRYAEAQDAVRALSAYLSSGEWMEDYEADEAGRLPENLKRGVLSQDGIWNVLGDCHELDIRMLEMVTDHLKNK